MNIKGSRARILQLCDIFWKERVDINLFGPKHFSDERHFRNHFMYNCSKSQAGLLTEFRARTQHFRISYEYPFYSASCVFSFLRRSFLTELSVLGCKTEGPPRDLWGMTEPWQKSKWVLPTIPSTPHSKNWQQRAVWPTPLFPWIISSFRNCFRGLTNNAGLWFWTSQAAEALGQENSGYKARYEPRRGSGEGGGGK